MKKYIIILFSLFISFSSMAQSSYYDTQWKEVAALIKKQKSQDAESIIKQIMATAKKEKNKEHLIKSLIFLRQAVAQRDEQNSPNTIQDFEKEISGLEFPEKNIMHSMIASLYHQHYQNNRYKIYQRTEIAEISDLKYPTDIETWTPQLFFNKIHENYEASLNNSNGLKEFPISQFPELITKGQNTENLQPTLFDVLVHRTIDYYSDNEIDITKAAYFFKLNNDKAFATARVFADLSFQNQDDFSTKYLALSYFQLATRFHLNDAEPDALIDLECQRLEFVKNQYDGQKGDEQYIKALEDLIKKYPNNETVAKAMLALAQELQGSNKVAALNWAKKIKEKFPDCIEMQAAQRIEASILEKTLTLTTEKADVGAKNILGQINFQNIDKVYFKIIPLDYKSYTAAQKNNYQDNWFPTGKSIRDWSVDLNKTEWQGDKKYDAHTTETKIDALPTGYYAIAAAGDKSFNEGTAPKCYSLFQATDISYIISRVDDDNVLYVVHRQTGKPMENVTVNRFSENYDYNQRQNKVQKIDTKVTDKDGRIVYANESEKYQNFDLEIISGDQKLYADNAFYSGRSYQQQDREYVTFFTDRAIYRPGQTIYFKGIYIKSAGDNRDHNVVANKKIEVILKDANYKDVKKLELTTNEFGSINGSFTAPEGLLNGRFTIHTDKGQTQIRVEEYKRPKFEVVMDTLQKNVKLNETIEVSGVAKAYAGNSIEGAKVTYIVRRKVRWPYYWCYYYWGGSMNNDEIVVSQGETLTDAEGKFKVSFFAEGDENIDPRTKPFYDFEVSADVTDLNGEVRSDKKSYAISQQSLILSVNMPEQQDFNKFNAFMVNTTNVQGKFTAADVKLEFIKLQAPNRFLKKRLWQAPKENLLTADDFEQFFPDYEFDNESNPLFWKEEKKVWSKTVSTEEGKPVSLQKIAPNGGYYLLKATTRVNPEASGGTEIVEKKVIRLINTSNLQAENNEALFTYLSNNSLEPGDNTSLSVASVFKNAFIQKTIVRQGKTTTAWSDKNEQFSISEKDRGGFTANYFMVQSNRLYQENVVIAVPWSNKDLEITYETFRDKILPGSTQEWKIKISGNKKEQVSAEIVAAMYDASLDAFAKNDWANMKLFQNNYMAINWNSNAFGTGMQRTFYSGPGYVSDKKYRQYPVLNMYGLERVQPMRVQQGLYARSMSVKSVEMAPASGKRNAKSNGDSMGVAGGLSDDNAVASDFFASPMKKKEETAEEEKPNLDEVQLRTNLSETAFFLPELQTDKDGNIIFSFTAPEALTRWNVKTLAHTKDLKTAYLEKTLVTQKELMLTPNHPRFMRENDVMVYSSKLSNLADKNISGTARLQLINAMTNENIDTLFNNTNNEVSFDLAAGKSQELTWNIKVPESFTEPVLVRIVAKAGNLSDGEQQAVPLLLNSMLVTETIPLPVRPNTTKNFRFDKLLNSAKSSTLKHHKLTVEYTSNPAWYAVQALPYLTDYPYDCSEQTFNRYYANALAQHIANSSPRIQEIFSKWKDTDTAALLSNLEKNQELKSALLQETPWVFEAENETAQKKLLANLFNMNRMSKELAATLDKLEKLQTSNGGFAWFKGMPYNPYITQYIITGIARLQKLGVAEAKSNEQIQTILNKAIPYLDARLVEQYEYLKSKKLLANNNLSYHQIQFMYMRSFFQEKEMNAATKTAFNYYKEKAVKHWMDYNKYMQGMLAISMNRYDESKTAYDIMDALRQNAIHKEEMGMYWKEFNQASYWWYEAPIEAHSLLMEAFREMPKGSNSTSDFDEVDEMRIWLLKQKQTQQWATTKATADACYALLLGGTDWLAAEPIVTMELGSKKINLADYKQEAGTGYTKFSIPKENVKADMGNISVTVKADKKIGTTWGAVYWQYFEQLDKITEAETPLSLKKQVYKVVQGDRGESLVLLNPSTSSGQANEQLQVGDKVKVRIELRVDRRMEFVHMKDMRGACFEPTNVLSNYKYQNGLGYYESTKDASTQFFFDNLNPGTYVFEYPMFATMRGDYSNGITTIQCMYAPEFSSHSEGIRVKVK